MSIDDLRKIAEEATQGGWIADGSRFNHYLGRGIGQVWGVNWRNDLQFIATFNPEMVLALLDRVETAEQALQRVRELHQKDYTALNHPICNTCGTPWPCPTIQALDGAPEPEEKP